MILGIGVDMLEIARLEQAVQRHGERFLARLFTPAERAVCAQRARGAMACYAKRFAAKEALVKALGSGFRDGLWFTDIEVLNDAQGKPVTQLSGPTLARLQALSQGAGRGETRIHLSLSDERRYAIAQVVIEAA
ncbi:holo-ACP synthase [Magnetofaba australis]|uniref:Holo-[acyl-carrier-protein] synthase n=1 Tax=Magnetofaba australis IT-1 TaxID=1434232 RepID=A0A1Y2K6R1_9PROT|nr:holo-ACP synthase [Magnetofaba australis]OSM05233.1 putative 4'-phosphopantetheinyl transferase [Magnetofaba australis IT-1]